MPKLLIMAGGTGGHIFPGLAVAEALPADWNVSWLGTADRMEADIVPKHDIPFFTIQIQGIRGNSVLRKLALPIMLIRAVIQAYKIIKNEQPDAVLGMGGYASGPGGIAAKIAGLPIFLHEQNAVLGMTNRWLSKIAKTLFTGFPLLNQGTLVGNPVRQAFADIPAPKQLSENEQISVLVIGGSLGAQILNKTLPNIFSQLSGFAIVHQCGKGNSKAVKAAYVNAIESTNEVLVTDFIDDMASAFKQADIIICRAGALTVAEVAMAGRAAIFVPLPSAVDDHQTQNARYLSQHNAAYLLPQSELSSRLLALLKTIQDTPMDTYAKGIRAKTFATPAATHKIVTHIIDNTVVSQ